MNKIAKRTMMTTKTMVNAVAAKKIAKKIAKKTAKKKVKKNVKAVQKAKLTKDATKTPGSASEAGQSSALRRSSKTNQRDVPQNFEGISKEL
mmetsp:Transcript_37845/g.80132  ORF Transcript_37845/g.80132 Transcript_37845/m.80132 type:complete len:92 (+) Transcript_37845:142-417(+)